MNSIHCTAAPSGQNPGSYGVGVAEPDDDPQPAAERKLVVSRRQLPPKGKRPTPKPTPSEVPRLSPVQAAAAAARRPKTYEDKPLPPVVEPNLDGWGRLKPGEFFAFEYGIETVKVRWVESGKAIVHQARRPDVIVALSTATLPPFDAVRALTHLWTHARTLLAERGLGTRGGHGAGSGLSFRATPATGGWHLSVGANEGGTRIHVPDRAGVFVPNELDDAGAAWHSEGAALLRQLLNGS
jgi:hypothetical protein